MAGLKDSERTSHTTSDLTTDRYTQNKHNKCRQISLRNSRERGPCPRLVKVYIIGQTLLLEDNEQCREKLCFLCHTGPGWQRHTNTQNASNTLAPSSLVSSVLQRHYCCPGSTLSRQFCLFCGLWHRWVVCLASPAFSAILLWPHANTDKTNKKENAYFLLCCLSPCFAFSIPPPPPSSSYSVSVYQVSTINVLQDR